jgi:hypothetical protein
MDKIQFERIIVMNYNVWICAKILINGEPLLETVENYEKAHISYESGYALFYQYCCAGELREQLEKALAAKMKTKIYLLVCSCMCAECNSIEAYLEETENSIILSGLHNYRFAREKQHNDVDYSELGGYEFDKSQFMSELEKLATFSPPNRWTIDWNSPEGEYYRKLVEPHDKQI